MQNHDVQSKAAQETMSLMEARRGFDELQNNEEKYLQGLEVKAEKRLERVTKKIEDLTTFLATALKTATEQVNRYRQRFESFKKGLSSILRSVDTLVRTATDLKDQAKDTIKELKKRQDEVEQADGVVQAIKKDLEEREEKLNTKAEEIEEMHAEALQLADWANSGKTYTISNKKK